MDFTQSFPKMSTYLPDDIDLEKAPKQWLIDVCTAVIGQPFKDWVSDKVHERNEDVVNKNDDFVLLAPKVAERIKASNRVSRKYTLCLYVDKCIVLQRQRATARPS